MLGFNNSAMGGNTEVQIESFILVQTGTYQPEHVRPFTVEVTENSIERLKEATNDGRNLGVAAVQQIAADVIAPRAQTQGEVPIVNGWGERRFRFMMKVWENNRFFGNTRTCRILFGCSDHCSISPLSNSLDPNMRIYFNSETVIVERQRPTEFGVIKQAHILGSNQILAPVDIMSDITIPQNGFSMYTGTSSYLQRPEDVIQSQQTMQVAKRIESTGLHQGVFDRIIDQRSSVGEAGTFQYSNRRDTSPTRYLSSTLNAWQHSVKEAEMANNDNDNIFGGVSDEVMLGDASAVLRNQDIHSNMFMRILKERCNYMERGFVTLADLQQVFPELLVDGVVKAGMDNGNSQRFVNRAEHSMHWGGADHHTVAASLLAQVVPAIMMDNYFRVTSFAITNGHGANNYLFEMHPNGTRSIMDGIDMTPQINDFERRLITDAINSISYGNQIPFKISMHSDLAGDTVIDISLNHESVERFIAPTFIDSLFSPVITRDASAPAMISNDLTYLVKNVIPTKTQQNILNSSGQPVNMQPYQHPVAQPAQINPKFGDNNAYDFSFQVL